MEKENLTYSIIYSPDITQQYNLNYVCSDSKIHIRLRDFNKPQIVKGFEKKLTYLISYLINFSYINKLFDICDVKTVLNAFLDSENAKKIYSTIKYDKGIDFKSIRITPNYNKKETCPPFGNIDKKVFPLIYDNFGNYIEASLETFLSKLKVNLIEFLFNDSYSIIIHENESKDVNAKFINKEIRKTNRITDDFVNLW